VVFAAVVVGIVVVARRAEPLLRALIVERLEERFHARVELDSFHISLVRGLWAEGKGLRIWPPANVERGAGLGGGEASAWMPLIQVDEFRFHAPLHYKPDQPIRISAVELKGVDIDVPPRSDFARTGTVTGEGAKTSTGKSLVRFEVSTIECQEAHLKLEPEKAAEGKPPKVPLEFAVAWIRLTDVNTEGATRFKAQLTNPRPKGTVSTSGTLGPWTVDDPGETPAEGEYRFDHADLSVFRGIAGILNSTGKYKGVLRELVVDGETDTPDFRLTHFGTAMPLKTRFHAKVDGTNGDTWLDPVDATLGRSHFTAEGEVVRTPTEVLSGETKPGGHEIALTVKVDRGRMEDFLSLTSKSGTPLLTGDLALQAKLEIPPGLEPPHKRLKLSGRFALEEAEFTSAKVQDKIGELSLRGQGEAKEAKRGEGAGVRSAMESDFKMADGVIWLSDLKYTVPGAEIDMKGAYGLDGGSLDFAGVARTQAKVSQMVGGWKGVLLRPADRFFEKDGAGTEVPIHIDGTRQDPKFGIDFGRMKHTSPATPGDPK